MVREEAENRLSLIAELILASRHAVIFTGAGVSTESGIPDFRSPGGIWDRFDQSAFNYSSFLSSRLSRQAHWELFRTLSHHIEPNPAHFGVAELCRLGFVKAVITQNIDNLHQRAGVPDDLILELHGSMKNFTCLNCLAKYPLDNVEALMRSAEVPECPHCHGILKPDVVFFGESLPRDALERAASHSRSSDLFIVIGSTLAVYPAAYMPEYALSSGAGLVIINLTATPMDNMARVVMHSKAGEVIPEIVREVKRRSRSC
ncbi:MAG: NAD-dependent deacylase [Dehalococcoidaceae bacterium]|nr:NAD-dependent deacylase [Dehalococcoidaceae bacterium]